MLRKIGRSQISSSLDWIYFTDHNGFYLRTYVASLTPNVQMYELNNNTIIKNTKDDYIVISSICKLYRCSGIILQQENNINKDTYFILTYATHHYTYIYATHRDECAINNAKK